MPVNSRNIISSCSVVCDLHEHFALTLWFWCHSCTVQEVALTRRESLLKANEPSPGFAYGCITPRTWWTTDATYRPWEPSQAIPTLSSITSSVSTHLLLVWSKGASSWGSAPCQVCQSYSPLLLLSLLLLVLYEYAPLTSKISCTLCMARNTHVLNAGWNMCYYLFNSRRAHKVRCRVAEKEIESHSSAWTTNLFFLNSYPLNLDLVPKDILISWEQNRFLSLQGRILNSLLTWLVSFQLFQAFCR